MLLLSMAGGSAGDASTGGFSGSCPDLQWRAGQFPCGALQQADFLAAVLMASTIPPYPAKTAILLRATAQGRVVQSPLLPTVVVKRTTSDSQENHIDSLLTRFWRVMCTVSKRILQAAGTNCMQLARCGPD